MALLSLTHCDSPLQCKRKTSILIMLGMEKTLETNLKFVDLSDYPLGFAMLNRYLPKMINFHMENFNKFLLNLILPFSKMTALCLVSFKVDTELP